MSLAAPSEATLHEQVAALLASDRVTAPTRSALQARLDFRAGGARALEARRLAILRAVARRLVPLGELDDAVDVGGQIDAALADGPGDGWRYAAMPADLAAIGAGLDALGSGGFLDIDDAARDVMLAAVRAGMDDWPVPSTLWFEEVNALCAQAAFGHPLVQASIGYDGMADANGWQIAEQRRP